MITPRHSTFVFNVGDCFYVCGGIEYNLKNPRSDIIEEYDEKTNMWKEIDLRLPLGLEFASCVLRR